MANYNETMIDLIYDTLMNNKQYPQFNVDNVENQLLDYRASEIEFDYNGEHVVIKINAYATT